MLGSSTIAQSVEESISGGGGGGRTVLAPASRGACSSLEKHTRQMLNQTTLQRQVKLIIFQSLLQKEMYLNLLVD